MKRAATLSPSAPSKRTKKSQIIPTARQDDAIRAPLSKILLTKNDQFVDVDRKFLLNSSRPWKILSDELPGADVFYLPNFLDRATANNLLVELDKLETCAW